MKERFEIEKAKHQEYGTISMTEDMQTVDYS